MLDEVRRRLHLGMPHMTTEATIAVADIVGTATRAGDFDGCWRPRPPALARRIAEIGAAHPGGLNEAIDVVRVDQAYFVVDGHKRVSMAHADGREFIDARVSEVETPFALAADVALETIDTTARELSFREDTGLLVAEPSARFAVSSPDGYAELREALESYGYELMQRIGRLLSPEEVATAWYRCVYRPTVEAAQAARLPQLLRACTEADLFLALHQQSRRLWGKECRAAQEEADHLVRKILAEVEADGDAPILRRIIDRTRQRKVPELLDERRGRAAQRGSVSREAAGADPPPP